MVKQSFDKKTRLQKMLRTLHGIDNTETPLKSMISNSSTLKSVSTLKSLCKTLKIPEQIVSERSIYSMYAPPSSSSITFLSPKSRSIFDASKSKRLNSGTEASRSINSRNLDERKSPHNQKYLL